MNDIDGLHGAFTYRTARAAIGDHRLRIAIERGNLVAFGRGVLLDGSRALDLRTRCAGALLLAGPSAVVVGSSAAALHGCTAVAGFPVHVSVPHDQRIRSRNGLVVHQNIPNETEVTTIAKLRVVTLPAAIGEVLCTAARRAALACADQALRRSPPHDRPALRSAIHEYLQARPDPRGTRQAHRLLALATGRPNSAAESAAVLAMVDAGFPGPACQYEVRDPDGQLLSQLDFAWPDLHVGVRYQGATGRRRLAAEVVGEADLRRRGWLVLRADPEDLVDPRDLCTRLRTAFDERRCAA
ncbi:MAG TPA: hypothetical protein VG756_09890 [Pseudonocardiaceae bacterium]|jgi:hypothetical protein|nr:hypothetical protein [Pseudonocardiaceae bacterium]